MANKRLAIIAGALSTLGLASVIGFATVNAQSTPSGNSLVEKIAQRFNLNKADVQKVFDENRSEHEAERQQRYEDRLSQAVKDGKLTATQETKLLDKLKELQSNKEDLKDNTPEQRHQAMKQKHDELEQWAKDNSIPEQYLPGPMRGHGPMGMHGDHDQDDQ